MAESPLTVDMASSYFSEKLKAHLAHYGLSSYRVALMAQLDPALLNKVLNAKRKPTNALRGKLAGVNELSLDMRTLQAWRAVDQLPKDVLERALDELRQVGHGRRGNGGGSIRVPCKGWIDAGGSESLGPACSCCDTCEFVGIPGDVTRMFCLTVRGGGLGPRFENGGLLLLPAERWEPGSYFVIQAESEDTPYQLFQAGHEKDQIRSVLDPGWSLSMQTVRPERLFQLVAYKKVFS